MEERKDYNGDIIKGMRVAKGSSATFSLRLGTKPTADVPVELYEYGDSLGTIHYAPGSVTFTPNNWNDAQTITVSSTNTPEGRSGNSADLLIRTGDTDDTSGYYNLPGVYQRVYEVEPPAVRLQTAAITVDEGSSYSYSVWLNTQPTADVTVTLAGGSGDSDLTVSPTTLTFTTANWDYPQSARVSAAQDDDLANGSRTINLTASGGDYAGLAASLTATEREDDSASIVVSATSVSVPEGATASYTVHLSNEPSGDVTIALSATGDGDITLSTTSLDFNATNWRAARTVTLTAAEDTDDLNGTKAIRHTASGADFGGAPVVAVTATEADNDRRGLAVKRPGWPLTINPTTWDPVIVEGGSYSYTVKLGTAPTADVTIALSASGDSDVTVAPASLTFNANNYANARTVTISAAHDDNDYLDDTATVSHAVSSSDPIYVEQTIGDVAVTVDDDDAGVILSESAVVVMEGNSTTYNVKLTNKPTAEVTVTIEEGTSAPNNDTSIRVSSPSNKKLTFTEDNWDTPQTVRLRANSDSDRNANNHEFNGTRLITHTASGALEFVGVSSSLIATERDSQARVLTRNSANSDISGLSVVEESTATYAVSLNAQPAANVSVTIAEATGGDADTDLTVASSKTLTFTPQNYATAQTVTLSAGGDNDTDITVRDTDDSKNGNQTGSIRFTTNSWDAYRSVTLAAADDADSENGSRTINHTANGGGYSSVAASLTATEDEDDFGFRFSPPTGVSVPERGTATYTVELLRAPTSDVTVTIAEGAGDADITVTGPSNKTLTFTSQNYAIAQTVTLSAAYDADAANGSRTINHTAASADNNYDSATASLTASEADDTVILLTNPRPPFHGAPLQGSVLYREGADHHWAEYEVSLRNRPTGEVTVTITSQTTVAGGNFSFSPKTIVFNEANYHISRGVFVEFAADNNADAGSVVLSHTASGGGYDSAAAATATISEIEPPLTLSISELTISEGGTATYTVALSENTGNLEDHRVTLAYASGGDSTITVDTDPVAPGNQNTLFFHLCCHTTPQTVTVSSLDDNKPVMNPSRTILHKVSTYGNHSKSLLTPRGWVNATGPSLTVKKIENDQSIFFDPPRAQGLTVPEGGSATTTVSISVPPSAGATTTVTISESTTAPHNDTDITMTSPSNKQLHFTAQNYSMPQTVTFSAASDEDLVHGTRIFTFGVSGVGYSISSPYKTIEGDTTVGLAASGIGTSTATLGLVNHSGNHSGAWWYKRTAPTGDDTCHSVANATTTPRLSGLSTSTTYTYKAYDATNCANADVMASETFTTLASESTLTATSTTATTARLDIAGYTGSGWYYKYTSPTDGQCSSSAVTATTTRATGLATSTSFTFGAYADSGCSSLLATSNEVTTGTPYFIHASQPNGRIIIGLRGWNIWFDGTWYAKQITPPDNTCDGPYNQNKTYTGLTSGTDYAFGAYNDSNCSSLVATTTRATA